MVDARNRFSEAQSLYDGLAQLNRDVYQPRVAETLDNIGNLDRDQNMMQEAWEAFSTALAMYTTLDREYPGQYLQELESAYRETLDVSCELSKKSPDVYRPQVAEIRKSLGIFYHGHGRTEEAHDSLGNALAAYRMLASESRDRGLLERAWRYLSEIPDIYSLLEIKNHEQYDRDVESTYNELLEVGRELAQRFPDAYRPKIAMRLKDLGILNRDQGRKEEARGHFTEALAIYKSLAQENKTRADMYGKEVEATQKLLDSIAGGKP